MNKAITLLKKRKAELDYKKAHNDRIDNELPKIKEQWLNEGIDFELMIMRAERLYGDRVYLDEQELNDINAVLKYLNIDF